MHIPTIGFVGLIAGACCATTLVEEDLDTPGDGLIMLDTATGLHWLDLDQTVSISYDEMLVLMEPGGPYEGFRHATVAEIDALYTNAGILERGWINGYADEVAALMTLNGQTFDQLPALDRQGARGITCEEHSIGDRRVITEHLVTAHEPDMADSLANAPGGFIVDDFPSPTFGHWLILEDVPCEGDADGNGAVEIADISYVIFRLGNACPAPGCDGDANGDGSVDSGDIGYIVFRLGDACSS